MIVVLDTNVWVSALHFASKSGTPTRALERAITRDVIAICSPAEDEIRRILTSKFRWQSSQVNNAMHTTLARALRVPLTGAVHLCRDPEDNIFFDCAAQARADVLVAGDKDLLVLGSFQGTQILTPAQYLALES